MLIVESFKSSLLDLTEVLHIVILFRHENFVQVNFIIISCIMESTSKNLLLNKGK